MKNICIITGSRAEYGLLKGIITDVKNSLDFNLLLFVTGTHLEEKYGNTYKIIENDGFVINEKIKMDLKNDTSKGIVESMSKEMIGLAECFTKYDIDLVMILGDRYEMLVAAQVALIFKIEVAHLGGGDVTEGAYDDAIRNAITKIAKYHFVTCESSYQNVLNMRENKEYVYLVGNPGIHDIVNFKPIDELTLLERLNIVKRRRLIFVINHTETLLSDDENKENMDILCDSLTDINDFDNTNIIFIHSNADNGHQYIFNKINGLINEYKNIYVFKSLERELYLNIIHYCNCFVGNSSSGIYEVPLFKKITLNIGNRQKGRECGNSVIHMNYHKETITNYINNTPKIDRLTYPYVTKNSSKEILSILKVFL